jgi:hypothetical protein
LARPISSADVAKCWGQNAAGQLGDGTTSMRLTPVQVTGLLSGVSAISAGFDFSCAVVNDGVMCWGTPPGTGSATEKQVPVQAVEPSGLTLSRLHRRHPLRRPYRIRTLVGHS